MTPDDRLHHETFPAAREIVKPKVEQTESSAYRLAFADPDFLLRRETRGIRFQLELLKPDLTLQEHHINATLVVYGSARFLSRDAAEEQLAKARHALENQPSSEAAHAQVEHAQRVLENSRYYEDARTLGRLIADYQQHCTPDERLVVCTGGGPGVMEAANRGVYEGHGTSIGLNIVLPHEQTHNPYITPELCFKFHYFATRKMHFMMRAKALVAFPGGFGTLDELFETLTLIQNQKARRVPVVLYGSQFWSRLVDFEMLVDIGTIARKDLELFRMVDTPEAAWKVITDFYQLDCGD